MIEQIIVFASELKSQLKRTKQQHENSIEWEHFYKHFKKLYGMIEDLAISKGKLPHFYESLHTTTVDMRMKLLGELGKQENRYRKLEKENEKIIFELKKQMQNKNKVMAELQKKLQLIKSAGTLNERNNNNLQGELKDKLTQLDSLKKENKCLRDELNQKMEIQNQLLKQIKQLKEHQNNSNHRRFVTSPGRVNDFTKCRTFYDNVHENAVGSFIDLNNFRNYTQLENTYIQQETDRKVKSASVSNRPIKVADQLWRFILLQATSLQQFITISNI